MAQEPASIRYKNPGAMWGSALAIKWGAEKKAVTLNDGKGQGNNIAVFPTHVQGICAQLDLWRTSKHYRNRRFAEAIATWSGGNNAEDYIRFVLARVPGMTRDTIMDDAFWRSEKGIAFLKAQAWHEAGKAYPAPDADWIEAQRRVFGAAPAKPKPAQPAPQPVAPGSEPITKEEQVSFLKRWWLRISGGAGLTGLAAVFTDPWVVGILCCFALVVAVLIVWFMGPARVRGWVRRQVQ